MNEPDDMPEDPADEPDNPFDAQTVAIGKWSPPPPAEISEVLDGFEVSELIGYGGMGAVYKGIQTSVGREVAIKILPKELGENPEFEARFRREAQVMGNLNHSHIVHTYDFGRTPDGQLHIIMEYVEGTDLQKLIAAGKLDDQQAFGIVRQICDALEYAHGKGFIHRDIKPANILISYEGIVKVADFGLAKLLAGKNADQSKREGESALTMVGSTVGTPDYMAPEQFDEGDDDPVDHRSDLYSLGVLFYQMLTGELPRGAVRTPSEKVKSLDIRIDDVVFKAMESNPGARYQSADDLKSDIEIIASGEQKERFPKRQNRRLSRLTKAALTLLMMSVLVGGLNFYAFSKRGDVLQLPGVAPADWTDSTNVIDALAFLGEARPAHSIQFDSDQVKVGERLVFNGQLKDAGGGATPLVSHYFRCTDCHNTKREDANLAVLTDPQAKLEYAVTNDIPLLQATTFAGMVNRETWYNDDYAKKYRFSPTVQLARNDLRKAIQLCCKECSQGRAPEKWEEDALLAYFWSLQWKFADLDLKTDELETWKTRAEDPAQHTALVSEIKSRYALKSPATFSEMPEDGKQGFALATEPDLEIGRQVFEVSCLHCHDPAEGAAEKYFRDDEESRAFLRRKFKSDSTKSAYGYIRLGTHPEEGQRLYMPNYPIERLSDFQIESLRAFLVGEEK